MKNDCEMNAWDGRALLTDLYQLTMAYGYWKSGRAEREAVFHLFFRKAPFQSGFTIAAGLATAIDFIKSFHFTEDDLQFLSLMTGNDGKTLFEARFLEYLRTLRFACDVDAIPEGTVVFAGQRTGFFIAHASAKHPMRSVSRHKRQVNDSLPTHQYGSSVCPDFLGYKCDATLA